MRYSTFIAAVILGISPAAFTVAADQQQPYATPQAGVDVPSSENDQDEDSGGTSDKPKRLVIVVPVEMQDTMEQLVAFLKSSPDAEILIMAPGQSERRESQDVFRLQSGESPDEGAKQ